jgi:hypothetical protein
MWIRFALLCRRSDADTLLALMDKWREENRDVSDGEVADYDAMLANLEPEGRTSWTMQLLAGRLVELNIVESISDETVRRTLKGGRSSRGSARNSASPA